MYSENEEAGESGHRTNRPVGDTRHPGGLPTLLFVLNLLRDAAVPNILADIAPHLTSRYSVVLIALESIDHTASPARRLSAAGVRLLPLLCRRRAPISALAKLSRSLAAIEPAIVHTHLGRADLLASVATRGRCPVITTFHNVRRGHCVVTQVGYVLTDGCVTARTAVSSTVRRSWYSSFPLGSPCEVIPNPVDGERVQAKLVKGDLCRVLGVDPDRPIVTSVGRFVRQKRLDLLLRAIPAVEEAAPGTQFVLCGWGPLKGRLERLVHALGIDRYVHFCGPVGDVGSLLNASDLFVNTSAYEGHSVALVEAMAAGVPVVASPASSNLEFLQDGVSCHVADPLNSGELAAAIVGLLRNGAEARELAAGARRCYHRYLTPETVAFQYLALYDRVLESAGSRNRPPPRAVD